MEIYLLIMGLLVVLSMANPIIKKEEINKLLFTAIAVILILLAGLRHYSVGRDTLQYINAYTGITSLDRYELGFSSFLNLLYKFSTDFQFLIFVSSVIIFIPIMYSIFRHSKNYYFSLYLLIAFNYYAIYLNAMRQSMAVAIVLVANELYRYNKNCKIFIFLIVSAVLFHNSAIIAVLIPLLYKIKLKTPNILLGLIVFCGIGFCTKDLFILIAEHISEYLPNVMYYTYIDSYEAQVNYSGIVLQGILYLLIFLSLYIIVKNSKDCEEDCNFYLNCIYLSVLFLVLSSQVTVLERFKFYFDIYLIVAVPMVFSKIKNLITKSIAYLVVFTIGFAYWYIIALYRPYWTETIDYRFFF